VGRGAVVGGCCAGVAGRVLLDTGSSRQLALSPAPGPGHSCGGVGLVLAIQSFLGPSTERSPCTRRESGQQG